MVEACSGHNGKLLSITQSSVVGRWSSVVGRRSFVVGRRSFVVGHFGLYDVRAPPGNVLRGTERSSLHRMKSKPPRRRIVAAAVSRRMLATMAPYFPVSGS